ncbi:MAG: methylmalonyl Co-A mutase-associated GTPase MeaB [Actinomycetota bacterium]
MDNTALVTSARNGDSRAIGRILTQIEDRTDTGRALIRDLFAAGGRAWLTGVTGTPGAGKSTLVSSLMSHVIDTTDKAAIVAVDPSSPFTGGAILGDRIRMGAHAADDRVFIRSVANRGSLGGISQTTPAIVSGLDGLGFSEIIIETVGIGQSEVEITTTADTAVVVVSPGWGDAIQVAKAGFLEIADIFVVNKADRGGADVAVRDLQAMLELAPRPGWMPPVIETVATTGSGVGDLWNAIKDHRVYLSESGTDVTRRRTRAAAQLSAALRQSLGDTVDLSSGSTDLIARIASRQIDPWTAADGVLDSR